MIPRTESFGHYGSRFREFKHVVPVSGHASSKSRHAAAGPILWEREEVECISRRPVSGKSLIEFTVRRRCIHASNEKTLPVSHSDFVRKKTVLLGGFSPGRVYFD